MTYKEFKRLCDDVVTCASILSKQCEAADENDELQFAQEAKTLSAKVYMDLAVAIYESR